MRTLPDRPNLHHLRHQAKDLLAGLRGSDPTATLADAQALVAEQYGFRSWTDLKTEVDRRQGQAEVADPELSRAIAERFDLGEVTEPMRSVARTDEVGRPWSLQTTKGRWWVRSLENWWPIVDIETEVGLQSAAARAGIWLPAPVRSRTGAIVEQIGEQRWRVNEWQHSGPPLIAPASAETTRSVGAILATLHRLALPVDRISPWLHRRLFTDSWQQLATRARDEGAGWADDLAAAVPTLVDLERIGSDSEDPTPVLSHTALGPAQVRRGEGGRLTVTGWEHAGGVPPAWELADALMHWAINPDGQVNVPAARGLVEGYAQTASGMPAVPSASAPQASPEVSSASAPQASPEVPSASAPQASPEVPSSSAPQASPELDLAAFRGAVTSLVNYVHGQVQLALAATDADDRQFLERSVRHVLAHLPTLSTLEGLVTAVAGVAV